MSKFNKNTGLGAKILERPNTVNHGGQSAFTESPKLQLASLMLTSFVKDDFYSSAENEILRLADLVREEPYFAAQAALYARNVVGMRSITHVTTSLIANQVKGEKWTRPFFYNVVRRPDDATEILAFYMNTFGRSALPNSLKDGLGSSMEKFDAYQLGKYRGAGKSVSLVDLINLTHPSTSNWGNKDAISQLMTDTLRSSDTWERNITDAGSDKEAKSEAWEDMVTSGKMGYLALIRNLRNIRDSVSEDVLGMALEQLEDERAIKRSMLFPFQYLTARNQFVENYGYFWNRSRSGGSEDKSDNSLDNRIRQSIERAMETALANVPTLPGSSLIAVDSSGSMQGSSRGDTSFADIASLFAAAIYKGQNGEDTDVMTFDGNARYEKGLNARDSLSTLFYNIRSTQGGATNFNDIFDKANRKYDRVIILSDMQALPMKSKRDDSNYYSYGHRNYESTVGSMNSYCARHKTSPKIYSLDLAGYGTLQFPEKNVYALAGFSEKVFDLMALMENDRNAMLSTIEAVTV